MVSPLPQIVTLSRARKEVNGTGLDDDVIADKLEQATALVLDHIWRDDDDWVDTMIAWTPTTAPGAIRAAVLCQLAELYRFRGDDVKGDVPDRAHGFLAPMVVAYLAKYRDPAIA